MVGRNCEKVGFEPRVKEQGVMDDDNGDFINGDKATGGELKDQESEVYRDWYDL